MDQQDGVIKGYRLIRPLGKGGMGTVFVAERLATHEMYAMKFLVEGLAEEEGYETRFAREVQALRAIRHPHVVDIFDWSVTAHDHGRSFIVMELLDGERLDELLRREKTLPAGVAIRIMLQVLDGLGAAHRVGVLHRDIGPSNIMLTRRPSLPGQTRAFHVKLLDFGLARSTVAGGDLSEVTTAGSLMGKAPYTAPEMFHGERTDERADIYACGVLFYRMLTGRLPYREAHGHLLWVERLNSRDDPTEYPPPSTFLPGIDEALDAVIVGAIRKRPQDRYQSAEKMQADLLAIEGDKAVDAGSLFPPSPLPPPTPAARATRPGDSVSSATARREVPPEAGATVVSAPRRPGTVIVAALVAAVVAAVAVVALPRLFSRQETAPGMPSHAVPAAPPSAAAPRPPAVPAGEVAPPAHAGQPPAPDMIFVEVPVETVPVPSTPLSSSPAGQPDAEAPTPVVDAGTPVPAVPTGRGTLFVDSLPWANVYLDRRLLGPTPIVGVTVAAGSHRLVLESAEGLRYERRVTVQPRIPTKIFVNLRREAAGP